MGAGWAMVPLGEVMRPALDPHKVDVSRSYPNLGIYGFGRGVFTKPPIEGTNTSASTLYRVRAGQFIYSRLFAFEGAYSIVPSECDGCFVSNEFPTFDCDQRRLDAAFLSWLFKRPTLWRAIAERSTGMGDRRQRIHPEQVLAEEVPLPPLDEQRRIVARIDALAAKIAEARGLREEATVQLQATLPQHLAVVFESDAPRARLGDGAVCEIVCGQHLAPEEQAEAGVPYITGPADFTELVAAPSRFALSPRACSLGGDVLLTVKGAGVGKANLAPTMRTAIGRQLFALRPQPYRLETLYLWYVVQHSLRHFRDAITATTVPGIGREDVECLEIPLPSVSEQRRIVAELDALQAKVDAVKRLHADTAAELNALLPAILDRAFKGEL